jgi:signal peptidase II
MEINRKRFLLVAVLIIVNIVLDQATKQLAQQYLPGLGQLSYLGDFFRLTYVENKGAFLSLGAGLTGVLRYILLNILPVLLLLGLLGYTLFSRQLIRPQIIAFSFILGGGISNVFDRILYGQVVDFMNVGLGGLRTGIFNFADLSIMIGLAIMLPFLFKNPAPKPGDEHPG